VDPHELGGSAWVAVLMSFILFGLLSVTAPAATGFFQVEKINDVWWLVAPEGQRFISKGVTTVDFTQDVIQGTKTSPYRNTNQTKYGDRATWQAAAARRLIGWGFNTLGAWSDENLTGTDVGGKRLAYTPCMGLGASFVSSGPNAWRLHGIFPDVFDPEFEAAAHKRARELCAPRKGDPWLLGWFTDNELHWGPDWRGKDELLIQFLALPEKTNGHAAAIDALRERYPDITVFNSAWKTAFTSWKEMADAGPIKSPVPDTTIYEQNTEGKFIADTFRADCDAFLGKLAERYFRVTSEALKAADPNHLNFGCRFAYVPRQPVVLAAAKYLDGISFNCYADLPRDMIERYAVFGKPVIIGEFSFRGDDSGLPNTKGAGPRVKTQAARAAAFTKYATSALSHPNLIGYHWFEHADQPKEGRFDGENSNYGLVTVQDIPYSELTRAMTALNGMAETLHAAARCAPLRRP